MVFVFVFRGIRFYFFVVHHTQHGQESRGGTTRSSRSSTRIGRRSSRTVQSSSESSSSLSDASSTNIVCDVCQKDRDDNKVILCDNCDHGFHTYCVSVVAAMRC